VEACWAEGPLVSKLEAKIGQRKDLRVARFKEGLLAIGPNLPWLSGLTYLGRQQSLYLPTLWEPNLPVDWLQARLELSGNPPWLLLPPGRAMGLNPT